VIAIMGAAMSRPSPIAPILLLLCTLLTPGPGMLADGPAASGTGHSWAAGERLEFTVSLGVLPSAARIRLDTLAPIPADDRGRLRLLSEVQAGPVMETIYPFFYRLISTVSLPRMLPQQGSRQMKEKDEQEFVALRPSTTCAPSTRRSRRRSACSRTTSSTG